MPDLPVELLKRLGLELSEPRLRVYLLLIERRWAKGLPGLSREDLLMLTGLSVRTLDQCLEWLEAHQFIVELQAVVERYFFADY